MPMTHSGTLVNLTTKEPPTIEDIALSLSRLPRFAGHTQRWWTVMDHTLFMAEMFRKTYGGYDSKERAQAFLAVLLHDAHECITGDIPSDVKPLATRRLQHSLDNHIVRAHFVGTMADWHAVHDVVKLLDLRSLVAEAVTVGPPRLARLSPEAFIELGFQIEPQKNDITLLLDLPVAATQPCRTGLAERERA